MYEPLRKLLVNEVRQRVWLFFSFSGVHQMEIVIKIFFALGGRTMVSGTRGNEVYERGYESAIAAVKETLF